MCSETEVPTGLTDLLAALDMDLIIAILLSLVGATARRDQRHAGVAVAKHPCAP